MKKKALKVKDTPERPESKNRGSFTKKTIQKSKSLIFLVIHKSKNQNSKGRSDLREIWVVTKYLRSKFTQPEEDSLKNLLVY